jgi:hypothetical protein
MGTAIAVRRDYSSRELRRLATRVKDAAQARRLLAIAAVLNGSSREEAAECMSSEHFGQLAWQFKRVSGSSGLKV